MAEAGKIDPMHQFTVEPLVPLQLGGYDISFTNSSLWLLIALALVTGFMLMGMKRQLVPRRWQMAVAASVLLALGLGVSLMLSGGDPGSPGQRLSRSDNHPSAPLVVRLGKVRSISGSPDIRLTQGRMPSQLIVEPDVVVLTCADGAIELECSGGGTPQTPQYAEYEVDLVNRRGSTLAWRSARQQPVMRTQLSFTLRDPASLEPGEYDLIVRGLSASHEEVVGRFWVQVSER